MRRIAIVLAAVFGFAGTATAGNVTYVLETPGVT